MCLIIVKPSAVSIPNALFNSALEHNQDGYGIMYADNGSVKANKGLDYSKLKSRLKTLENKEIILHLRMATHGTIKRDNCHPFKITEDLWFAHNGILRDFIPQDGNISDTISFNRSVLMPDLQSDINLLFTEDYCRYIESLVGKNNKLAFLSSDGRIKLINRDQWIEYNGLLLSNDYAYDAYSLGIIGSYDPLYYHDPYMDHDDSLELLANSSLQDIEDLAYTDPQYLARLVYNYFHPSDNTMDHIF